MLRFIDVIIVGASVGQAWADSGGTRVVPVAASQGCSPEPSLTSGCVWTGACPVGGCRDQCIANVDTASDYPTIRDRAFSEEFYMACPRFSLIYAALRTATGGRRLQSREPLDPVATALLLRQQLHPSILRGLARPTAAAGSADRHWQHGAARSMLSLLDYDYDSTAQSSSNAPPPPSGGPMISEDLPSNRCPTAAEIAESAEPFQLVAAQMAEVFAADERGEPISGDLQTVEYVLEAPNTYRWIAAFLGDPDRMTAYMLERCATEVLDAPKSRAYAAFLTEEDYVRLDASERHEQCVDNFDAFDAYELGIYRMLQACKPPFGATPDCFPAVGYLMLSSERCATAWAEAYNITDATIALQIAANVQALQTGCANVDSQELCETAESPVLGMIADLHESIPLKSEGELSLPPPLPVVPAAPAVCFDDDCDLKPEADAGVPAEAPDNDLDLAAFGAGLGDTPADELADGNLGVIITSAPAGADGDDAQQPAPAEDGDDDVAGDDFGSRAGTTLDSLFLDDEDESLPAAEDTSRAAAATWSHPNRAAMASVAIFLSCFV
eukprot:jgi/Ulvmu1/12423/UM009_0073.1